METNADKLRNALSPLYGLALMVVNLENHPELLPIVISTAKKAARSKQTIDDLLIKIENESK